jgi:hypothetical protein
MRVAMSFRSASGFSLTSLPLYVQLEAGWIVKGKCRLRLDRRGCGGRKIALEVDPRKEVVQVERPDRQRIAVPTLPTSPKESRDRHLAIGSRLEGGFGVVAPETVSG